MLENEPNGGTPRAAQSERDSQIDGTNGGVDDTATDRTEGEGSQTARRRRAATRPAGPPATESNPAVDSTTEQRDPGREGQEANGIPAVVFQPPQVEVAEKPDSPERGETSAAAEPPAEHERAPTARPVESDHGDQRPDADDGDSAADSEERPTRRRRRRGGRSRGKGKPQTADAEGETDGHDGSDQLEATPAEDAGDQRPSGTTGSEKAPGTGDTDAGDTATAEEKSGGTRRRRRRRRASGEAAEGGADETPDDPPNTVVKVREPRRTEDEVQSIKGSTRLEAKKQRRREGRDQGRRRPPVISESEFLARRESVERVLVVRQRGDSTQIAVLEDGILVEHYVDRGSHQSYIGNVYLGKVQNVLPSMEAAFVDIGKGRNGVLYAGEVNYDVTGLEGQPKRIEQALKSGQNVLVQVTKDPHAHKGARLTSQNSLPGRYLVYVPEGSMTGISRKLPERERSRLKSILKKVMPEDAGVIVRTAAEGASEEELSRDIARLTAQWEDIQRKAKSSSAPSLLYGEPDLTVRVVRDIFNEDFTQLVVSGEEAWQMVDAYVKHVAPHLGDRLREWTDDEDVFAAYRVDEQIVKALDRKVWLPSGGSLVIDRTEAMTVVDVNTGRFTGQGGNLEETVTKNNLEAAEELVRQLRLRDLGGIIVIDFIDMVLESNRELVLRRLLECLARDRTKHQVAEVTSLGLVQMTRKRVGQGLLEAFSQNCDCCNGRGVIVSRDVYESVGQSPPASGGEATGRGNRSGGGGHASKRVGKKPANRAGAGSAGAVGAGDAAGEEVNAGEAPQSGDAVPDSGDDSSAGDVTGRGHDVTTGDALQSRDTNAPTRDGTDEDSRDRGKAENGAEAEQATHEESGGPKRRGLRGAGRRRARRKEQSHGETVGTGSGASGSGGSSGPSEPS